MLNYVQGETVRLEKTFRDNNGELVDPATVRFSTYREADGVKTFYDYSPEDSSSSSSDSNSDNADSPVVRESEGVYYVDVDTTAMSGVYRWRVRSTGPSIADQDRFYVEPEEIDDDSSSDSSSS
jgi:hypothetical protein